MDELIGTLGNIETAEIPKILWSEEKPLKRTGEGPSLFPPHPSELYTTPSGLTTIIDENYRLAQNQTDTSATSKIEDMLQGLSITGIKVPAPSAVRRYMRRHDDMLDLVSEVCQMTRGCFPPSTELSLEVYHDPEIEDEYLTLYVRQEEYETDVLRKIKVILSGYSDFLKGKSGWFLVTTDFQPSK